jgi:hypothetical protein
MDGDGENGAARDAVLTRIGPNTYVRFVLWSFVGESSGRVKWCPSRGCAHAVEKFAERVRGRGGEEHGK